MGPVRSSSTKLRFVRFPPKVSIFKSWALVNLLKVWDFMICQVSRLLDLIVHSLYSHKEVFLRELVRLVHFSFFYLFYNWFKCVIVYMFTVTQVMRWISWGSWVWQSLLCLEMVVTLRLGSSLILITEPSPLRMRDFLYFFFNQQLDKK